MKFVMAVHLITQLFTSNHTNGYVKKYNLSAYICLPICRYPPLILQYVLNSV